jgi:Glycosyl transferase family 2
MDPVVTVVITSDYASGKPEGWRDLRATLAGLARQDFAEAAEFLLIESLELVPKIPFDLKTILPSLRVVASPETYACALKNEGARAASADLVALLDGDCTPDSAWLRCLVEATRQHPEVAVVSGRTTYGTRTFLDRVMGLIARSYLDEGRTAPTRHITINNCVFRKSVLLSHPFPPETASHTSLLQTEEILRGGGRLLFEPGMRVVHAYDGWQTEKDIRKSMGYGVIRTRRLDHRLPYAWMARLGYASVLFFVALRTLHSCRNCLRCAAHYGVAWYELPFAFALAALACVLEVPGMVRAVRGEPVGDSQFR